MSDIHLISESERYMDYARHDFSRITATENQGGETSNEVQLWGTSMQFNLMSAAVSELTRIRKLLEK